MELGPVEQRVLGCLLEKAMATPDHYPLTANALVAACNQSSNRNPVVHYDEQMVVEAVGHMKALGIARTVHSPSNRAAKYRHVVDEALGLDPPQQAVLCELLLRGPQTPGELRARTDRLLPDIAVDEVLESLTIVERLERQPGQREQRWRHLLGAQAALDEPAGGSGAVAAVPETSELEERLAALEARVTALESELGLS